LPKELADAGQTATSIINTLTDDVADARDNLLLSKISQTHYASTARNPDPHFIIGENVMLSTTNRRHEYKKRGEKRVAKFLPRWDGPYKITDAHPEASTYTLQLNTNAYPVFHVSQLKRHLSNDPTLFPTRVLSQPPPILTAGGLEEYLVDEIIDSRKHGRGYQFLVRWVGYGHEHDLWIAASELNECEALDQWYKSGGDGPDSR